LATREVFLASVALTMAAGSDSLTLNLEAWQAADQLLDELLQLPSHERLAALESARVDAEVRTAARALLAKCDVESELDRPLLRAPPNPPAQAFAGKRLGRWRLEEEIGRGGMAMVYRARSHDRREHVVALKIVLAHSSPQLVALFAQEIALQAKLNHPQLAQFFDAGEDALDGQSAFWLAMRLIDGLPIDRWCSEHDLPQRARIQLFLRALEAVSYAHSQLVVHCDIKPSNVVVERSSGQPVVLDFGIAALLDHFDQNSEQLRYLSPSYAAPEQFRASAPTTAMDVHGLGATLHQLLTGMVPRRAAPEQAPLRPSLLAMQGKLPKLEPNLEAIVLKALALDPRERYATVDSLRIDLERYLAHQSVLARSPHWLERLTLFCRRHRRALLVATAITVALLLGLGSALHSARQARADAARALAAEQAARAAETLARVNAERAREIKRFAVGLFEATIPTLPAASLPNAEELLSAAVARARSDQTLHPSTRLEMLLTLASVHTRRSQFEAAQSLIDEALHQAERAGEQQLLASALRHAARLDLARKDFRSADQKLRRAEQLLGLGPHSFELWFEVRFEQASSAMFARQFDIAESILSDAIERARTLNISPETYLGLINTQAIVLKQRGRLKQALPYSLETLELRERMLGSEHRAVALSLVNHANLLGELGTFAEADAMIARAEHIYQNIADGSYEPAAAMWRTKGLLAWLQGDWARAEAAYSEVNRRYATLRNVSFDEYPFRYHDQANIALALDQPAKAAALMHQLFARSAGYLKQYGASLNIREFQATASISHCRSGQPAQPEWLHGIERFDLELTAPHLRSHYWMALLECAHLDKRTDDAKSWAVRIRDNDSVLPLGRAREVQSRAQRMRTLHY
jgi:serine/threonine-protein kinase